jgi:hypothetical protein
LGGSALWLKDVVFKTRWIKNSNSFLSVPPLPPHAGGSSEMGKEEKCKLYDMDNILATLGVSMQKIVVAII